MAIKRGDIYFADLTPVVGSEQGGIRPVVIIQNDMGNRYSPTVIVAAITSKRGKHALPTHIRLWNSPAGLRQNSTILLEQVRTLDRVRLKGYIGRVGDETLQKIDRALAVSLGLRAPYMQKKGDGEQENTGGTDGEEKAGMDLLFC